MKNFIVDFDSTFVQTEIIEELAKIVLSGRKDKETVLSKIKRVTKMGMEGKISFPVSLNTRIKLLNASAKDIQDLIPKMKNKITPSVARNIDFFKKHSENIFIVSGGFREIIEPVVLPFHIKEKNIFANILKFDQLGNICGVDGSNLLAQERGKVRQVKKLCLRGDVYVLGDGYTDYEIKEAGAAHEFIAFTENVARQAIIEKADFVADSFDEFIKYCAN